MAASADVLVLRILANSSASPDDPVAANASSSPRFDPNRWTSVAADTFASFATSASVRFGPSRMTTRWAAASRSASLVAFGRGLIASFGRKPAVRPRSDLGQTPVRLAVRPRSDSRSGQTPVRLAVRPRSDSRSDPGQTHGQTAVRLTVRPRSDPGRTHGRDRLIINGGLLSA